MERGTSEMHRLEVGGVRLGCWLGYCNSNSRRSVTNIDMDLEYKKLYLSMAFFEIDLFDPSNNQVQKIALEARSNIEAYEIALSKITATSLKIPSPEDFKVIDFKRALLISRGKVVDESVDKDVISNASKSISI